MVAFDQLGDSDLEDDDHDVAEILGRSGVGADLLELFGPTDAAKASAAIRTEVDAAQKDQTNACKVDTSISAPGLPVISGHAAMAPCKPLVALPSPLPALETQVEESRKDVDDGSDSDTDDEHDERWCNIIKELPPSVNTRRASTGNGSDEDSDDDDGWGSILSTPPTPAGGSLADGLASLASDLSRARRPRWRTASADGLDLPQRQSQRPAAVKGVRKARHTESAPSGHHFSMSSGAPAD